MTKLALIAIPILVILALIVLAIVHTNILRTTRFTWQHRRVPSQFNGFRIVQLSDMHNARFGREQSRLIHAVEQARPNMIALTGDFIDNYTRSLAPVQELLAGIAHLAPVYFVDGNHDPQSPFYDEFLALLAEYNITVLRGATLLQHNGATMTLAGLPFSGGVIEGSPDILLAHSPLRFAQFAQQGGGLMLAGHVHGGQVATPGGQAILAPLHGEEGLQFSFFPPYSSGVYVNGDATMFLSRGLGTSHLPLRLFATPEVAIIELKAEQE